MGLIGGLPAGPPSDIAAAADWWPIFVMFDVLVALDRVPTQHRITSWYRTVLHNQRVGGHPDSQHLIGAAVDVAPPVWLPLQWSQQLDEGDHTHVQVWPAGVSNDLVRSLRR